MSTAYMQRIIEYLWPQGNSLVGPQVYVILDGARDRRIEPLVRFSRLEYTCLYSGRLSPRLQAAAPYVVHLAPDARFTTELLELGWGQSWGFFTVVPPDVTLTQHYRHFQTLLRVKNETGRILVFRFYDPRVLRTYLPTCTREEAARFFGPMPRILAEADEPDEMISYAPCASGVMVETISLSGRVSSDARVSEKRLAHGGSGQHAMLTIRHEQFAVLAEAEVRKFEEWMLLHLKRFFPEPCEAVGQPQLRETIRYGIKRAAAHGITAKRDVCKYIDMMMVFGRDFDTDKRLSWAGEILGSPRDPNAKIQALHEAARIHLRPS